MRTESKHLVPTRDAQKAVEKGSSGPTPNSPSGLSSLSVLIEAKPQTKAGQVQWLWPQIKSALREGHKLKQVWQCLVEDGLQISYSRLRWYVARLKKLEAAGADLPGANWRTQAAEAKGKSVSESSIPERPKHDALANLRQRMSKRPGFEFDEHPPDEAKLI